MGIARNKTRSKLAYGVLIDGCKSA